MLPVEWIMGSVAFPRGFSKGLSHVPPWCEPILGLKVEAVEGKKVSQEWTETSALSGLDLVCGLSSTDLSSRFLECRTWNLSHPIRDYSQHFEAGVSG